jgi:hypothetical protein
VEEPILLLQIFQRGEVDDQDLKERIGENPVSHWIRQRNEEVTVVIGG